MHRRTCVQFAISIVIGSLLGLSACQPQSVVVVPTLMVLPSETPTNIPTLTPVPPTDTPTPTQAPTETLSAAVAPTETLTATVTVAPTVDLMATQVAEGVATNVALQATVGALQTIQAQPTAAPSRTLTPTRTLAPTRTVTPTRTPVTVTDYGPALVYMTGAGLVRSCANSLCAVLGEPTVNDAIMATGRTDGEQLVSGNGAWFRVDWHGREGFIYSGSVSEDAPLPIAAPTALAMVQQPPTGSSSYCLWDEVNRWVLTTGPMLPLLNSATVAQLVAQTHILEELPTPPCLDSARDMHLQLIHVAFEQRNATAWGDHATAVRKTAELISGVEELGSLVTIAISNSEWPTPDLGFGWLTPPPVAIIVTTGP